MAQCPKCATPIAVDFGIYTCTTCDSVLFVDISGNVQLDSVKNDLSAMPAPNFGMPSPVNTNTQTQPAGSIGSMEFSTPLSSSLAEPLPEPPPQIMIPKERPPAADLSDIAKFGNSEASLGKDGPYIYDVLIWNIDSKEIREDLREALKDKRFGWDANRIMSSINQGAVRISQVNAVKAAVLINKIKNLPLGISWEQSMHTESI